MERNGAGSKGTKCHKRCQHVSVILVFVGLKCFAERKLLSLYSITPNIELKVLHKPKIETK